VDFRKNVFWIVLSVVLLAAFGVWALVTPSTEDLKSQFQGKVKELESFSSDLSKVKTAGHEEKAKHYRERLEDERKALLDRIKKAKIDVGVFPNAPSNPTEFDGWLAGLREKLMQKAKDAQLQLPPDIDKITFKEPSTLQDTNDPQRKRDYRLRNMAVI